MNRDLTNILEQYFYTNIWSDWKDISALYPQCSPPFRMENARAYMCTICDIGHFITRKEKHEVYSQSCVCHRCFNQTDIILTHVSILHQRLIFILQHVCSTVSSETSRKSTKLQCVVYRAFDMEPRIKLNIVPGPLKHFQRSEVFLALSATNCLSTQKDFLAKLTIRM